MLLTAGRCIVIKGCLVAIVVASLVLFFGLAVALSELFSMPLGWGFVAAYLPYFMAVQVIIIRLQRHDAEVSDEHHGR
jgi:ABC-type multidrug transport system permease subunit